MKKVVDDLLKYGEVQRGLLGVQIQDVTSELADKEGLSDVKGVFIAKVTENSAAEAAGLKDKDIIIAIDDERVNSTNELQEKVGKKSPGDKVKVGIIRSGKNMDYVVTLKSKDGKTTLTKTEKVETNKVLGCEFETIGRDERLKLKIASGVKLKSLSDKSALKKAGIPVGFVLTHIDKVPVGSVSEVKNSLENKKGVVFLVGINPNGSKGYYGFEL
jgi:S1-C subfamily serine protease